MLNNRGAKVRAIVYRNVEYSRTNLVNDWRQAQSANDPGNSRPMPCALHVGIWRALHSVEPRTESRPSPPGIPPDARREEPKREAPKKQQRSPTFAASSVATSAAEACDRMIHNLQQAKSKVSLPRGTMHFLQWFPMSNLPAWRLRASLALP